MNYDTSNNMTNPYARLTLYYDILLRDDSYDDNPGHSMSSISELYSIPISIVRHDIISIHKLCASEGLFAIRPDDSCMDDDEADIILDQWSDNDDYSKLYEDIRSGTHDDLPLSLMHDHDPDFRLSMTERELHALESLHSKLYSKHDTASDIYIKDSFRFMSGSDILLSMLGIINQAIDYGKYISFRYKNNKNEISTWEIAPLKIIYDSISNLYAILTVVDDLICVFRLDRIIPSRFKDDPEGYITITDNDIPTDHEIYSQEAYINEIAPCVWGMSFTDKSINVKVRFTDFGNIKRKLERELSYRKGKLYSKDGSLYYEDKVYGKEAFKMWIRGYGSSAEVIKPASLRREIKDALERHLNSFNSQT